ncbi:MAG: hypothetical protein JNK66_14080 [Chitinophagales bacterium]|nr:hypothetical protein [Chitinophagales bacterium]
MRTLFGAAVMCVLLNSCYTLPKYLQTDAKSINSGPGPEDMVIDSMNDRILVSCSARRKSEQDYGEIEALYPLAQYTTPLVRVNEPIDLSFNPHGIDLVKVNEKWFLLVVNHEHKTNINSVLKYEVYADTLRFISKTVHPLIVSPNAVCGLSNGDFIVSNDARKKGNAWEILFKLKHGQIIYCHDTVCTVATEGYCYANGIEYENGKVFLASTMQNKVWQFDIENKKLINRVEIGRVKGADNIRLYGQELIVPGHLRFVAFLKHYKNAEKLSPSTVFRINPTTKTTVPIFYDNGKKISAASTALIWKGKLYVSGVFNPQIAVVPLGK